MEDNKMSDRLVLFVAAGLIVVLSVLLVSKTADNKLAVFNGVTPNMQVAGIGMPPPQLSCLSAVYGACMTNPWYFGFPVSFDPGDYQKYLKDFCFVRAQLICSGVPLGWVTATTTATSSPSLLKNLSVQ